MTTSPYDLLAGMQDVRVIYSDDQRVLQGRRARWFPRTGEIVVDKTLRRLLSRCSLAHELGHVVLGHGACGGAPFDYRLELDADEFAARLILSDLAEVAREIATTTTHGHAAYNLRVTLDLFETRLATLTPDEREQVDRAVWAVHEGVGA